MEMNPPAAKPVRQVSLEKLLELLDKVAGHKEEGSPEEEMQESHGQELAEGPEGKIALSPSELESATEDEITSSPAAHAAHEAPPVPAVTDVKKPEDGSSSEDPSELTAYMMKKLGGSAQKPAVKTLKLGMLTGGKR